MSDNAIPTGHTALTSIVPSYLYRQYADDPNLQALVDAFNSLAQGYLDWFNETPLAIYTSPNISGPLLDWTAQGIYGIARPVLGTVNSYSIGALGTFFMGQLPIAGQAFFISGSASAANDDIYKRVLTWWLYRGDGFQMSIDWIKRRVARFLYGAGGTDIAYPPANPPSVALQGLVGYSGAIGTFFTGAIPLAGDQAVTAGVQHFVITVPNTTIGQALQGLVQIGAVALPFENQFVVAI